MLTPEEKQELAERCRESFTQVGEASSQAIDASQKAATAWQRKVDKWSAFTEEIGRGNLPFDEIIDYLESKGRKSELAEFLGIAIAALEADREAEKASTEADIACARAETFLADMINQGILDKDNKGIASVLKGLRENEDFTREFRENQLGRIPPGIEQAFRQKLEELQED